MNYMREILLQSILVHRYMQNTLKNAMLKRNIWSKFFNILIKKLSIFGFDSNLLCMYCTIFTIFNQFGSLNYIIYMTYNTIKK